MMSEWRRRTGLDDRPMRVSLGRAGRSQRSPQIWLSRRPSSAGTAASTCQRTDRGQFDLVILNRVRNSMPSGREAAPT
jgi:hypothetical protein